MRDSPIEVVAVALAVGLGFGDPTVASVAVLRALVAALRAGIVV